jgi:outer membrane protein OmpA-like peptidoglycan-associated protein
MSSIMIRVTVFAALLCFGLFAAAQDVPFKQKHFQGQEKEFKQARRDMKKGMKLVQKGSASHGKALIRLQAAHAFNPKNARLNHTIGELLLRGSRPWLSLPYFEAAYQLNPEVSPLLRLQLARGYHLNHRFSDATRMYDEHYATLKRKGKKRNGAQVLEWRRQSVTGDSLMQHPVSCFVDPLGDRINSPWPEYAPVLSHDGSRLWFTSRRPGSTGGKTDGDKLPFEDIYYLEKLGSSWSDPVNAGEGLNSPRHEAFVAVSADGNKIYIRTGEPTGDILALDWPLRRKPKPETISKGINSSSNETFGSFAPGGDTLWFVSTRKGGYGGKDIWIAEKNSRGKWKKPVNAGPVINSPKDEESPFFANDGKTLYFSSRGHETMGGYDIFAVTLTDSGYVQRRNLGWPVNSASDDLFFSLDKKERHGFFASKRSGGNGHFDLYKITRIEEEKPLLFATEALDDFLAPTTAGNAIQPVGNAGKPESMVLIKGKVTDQITGEPLRAIISVRERNTGTIAATAISDSVSGKYILEVNAQTPLVIRVSSPGKAFLSTYHDLTRMAPYTSLDLDFLMPPLTPGQVISLANLDFPDGQSAIDPSTDEDLNVLADLLNENTLLNVRIVALTREGEDSPELPGERIASVMKELISRGVAADRFQTDSGEAPDQGFNAKGGTPRSVIMVVLQ